MAEERRGGVASTCTGNHVVQVVHVLHVYMLSMLYVPYSRITMYTILSRICAVCVYLCMCVIRSPFAVLMGSWCDLHVHTFGHNLPLCRCEVDAIESLVQFYLTKEQHVQQSEGKTTTATHSESSLLEP